MPTSFHDREQAFEAKFAHDEEFRFLVLARGDRLFARWAADRLQLNAKSADLLRKQVLAIPNGPDHDRAVLRLIADSLAARGDAVAAVALADALAACRQDAMRQLTETPPEHL